MLQAVSLGEVLHSDCRILSNSVARWECTLFPARPQLLLSFGLGAAPSKSGYTSPMQVGKLHTVAIQDSAPPLPPPFQSC